MIILLHGQDTLRAKQKLDEIIRNYKEVHKKGLDLKYLDIEESGFELLKNEIEQTSIFNEKKFLIIKNAISQKDFKDKFLKEKDSFLSSPNIILFFEEKKVPESDRLLKAIGKKAKCQLFELLTGVKLENWVKKEIEKLGARISSEAVRKLIDSVGNDLWQMDNEIKKLASFRKGEMIKEEDVNQLVKSKIDTDIFKTIDAMAQKDKKRALILMHKHLEKGESPLYLLSMINFQFRNLLLVKDLIEKRIPYYSISKILKLHPFVVRKSYQQAGRFSLPELKKIYQNIFQVDLSIKTGRINPETGLDMLLTGI